MRDAERALATTEEILRALRSYDERDHAIEELERNIVRRRAELIAAAHEVAAHQARAPGDLAQS